MAEAGNTGSRVLVTGGGGYVGGALVPRLLSLSCEAVVYDTMYFGTKHIPKNNPNLTIVKADIRDTAEFRKACEEVWAVIHLACISNDLSFEFDENRSKSVNCDHRVLERGAALDPTFDRASDFDLVSLHGIER